MSRRPSLDPRVRRLVAAGLFSFVAALGHAVPAAAQSFGSGSTELPPILPLEEEIALARSAAPATVSEDATILVLERGIGYRTAVDGDGGVTCFVDRTWPDTVEPMCFDVEGSRTILPLLTRAAELRERGWSRARIDRDREEGIRSGAYPLPEQPALSWMLSAAQVLRDDDGTHVGSWKPHLMIYFPGMTQESLGLAGGRYRHGPFLSDSGAPTSVLVLLMPDFVEVAEVTQVGDGPR